MSSTIERLRNLRMTTRVIIDVAHHHVQVTTHEKHGEEWSKKVEKLEPGSPQHTVYIHSHMKIDIEEVES
jgi:hypothetical protein